MIRGDRELLAELARLNRSMASLCMRIMDGSASIAEQRDYADRLVAAGERLRRRGDGMNTAIVEGEVVVDRSLVLPVHTMEPPWSRERRW